jgi:hypothetical protein
MAVRPNQPKNKLPMKNTTTKHFLISGLLSLATLTGMIVAYRVADAKELEAQADPGVRVETIEVDFEQQVPLETTPVAAASDVSNDTQTQFMYLVALTVLGMIGIVSIIRDFRRDRTTRSRR